MNNPHLWLEEEINLDKSYALYFNALNSNKFFFPLEIYFFIIIMENALQKFISLLFKSLDYLRLCPYTGEYGSVKTRIYRIFYPVNTIPEILLKKL